MGTLLNPMLTPFNLNQLPVCLVDIDPASVLKSGQAYQDLGKTIPVTASGQPVGWIADQSGNDSNGYQDIADKRMNFAEAGWSNSLPCLDCVNVGTALRIVQSASLKATDQGPVTIAFVFRIASSTFYGTLLGRGNPFDGRFWFTTESGGINNFNNGQTSIFNSNSILASPFVAPNDGVDLCMVYRWVPLLGNIGVEEIYVNGVLQNQQIGVTKGNSNVSDWRVAEDNSGNHQTNLKFARLLIYAGEPDIDQLHAGLAKYGCISTIPKGPYRYGISDSIALADLINVIVAGDSISQSGGYGWIQTVKIGKAGKAAWLNTTRWNNLAIYGQQAGAIRNNFDNRERYFFTPNARNLFVLFAGTNDIFGGASATQVYQNNVDILAKAKALEATTVLVPMLPRGSVDDSAQHTKFEELRALMRSGMEQPNPIADVYASEIDTDNEMGVWGNQNNTVYYGSDLIHPTQTGQARLGKLLFSTLNRALVKTGVRNTGSRMTGIGI